MTGGNWMPELVALAGGENLFGTAGKHSPLQSWASVVAADPEVLFICPCGFDIPRTQAEMHLLQDKKEWPTLRAVRHDRVYIADGNQLFNRPGPRLVESLEVLAEVLHPELFHFGHKPRFWVRAEPSTSATR
jgi:iron complex transport system substrate-binding protein